jgi:hypothetical protein
MRARAWSPPNHAQWSASKKQTAFGRSANTVSRLVVERIVSEDQGGYWRASARDDARGLRRSPSSPAFLGADVGEERSVSQAMLNHRCQCGKQIPETEESRARR